MTSPARPYRLPMTPDLPAGIQAQVEADFEHLARVGLPSSLEEFLLDRYRLDVSTTYAGLPIRNPWGKASGQLSLALRQVEEDAAAGLGFVVLKTVIAQDAGGSQSMAAWAIPETRMVVEPIVGQSGESGWTVSWKGRGWWQSFEDYLTLVRDAVALGNHAGMRVVPSCKYHLPAPGESAWRTDEYAHTTARLLDAWSAAGAAGPMPLEKDFSPTLAGSDRAQQQTQILHWLATVPGLIRRGAGSRPVRVGIKLFNALCDDAFQVDMLRCLHTLGREGPDFLVFANRLFDPTREFDGVRGIACGGPDLSDRNLRVLDRFLDSRRLDLSLRAVRLDWSATGDIHSGRMAIEYALRGCTSFQMHTLFQLPAEAWTLRSGNKSQKVLHRLYFHPRDGFIVWLCHLSHKFGLADADGVCRFARLAGLRDE